MEYEKDFLVGLYRTMVRIRGCEESFVEPILDKTILCPVHLYSGEEAVATGVCAALERTDYVFGTHRSHGHYLAKGGRMQELVAEVYCKETGCARGRGGSMHIIDKDHNFIGSAPIVAGTISLALGAALASRIRNDGRVTVSFFGDGATGEGVLYESLNFASLRGLPLIFACENNFYSTHLPIRECRPARDISQIARPFDIKALKVDGNSVLDVYEASAKAVEACRNGGGPVFIEFLTYRLRGHVGPDDNVQGNHSDIRPANELKKWRRRDPIVRFRRYLVAGHIVDRGELAKIDSEVHREIMEAHAFARRSNFPERSQVTRYVFR